MIDLRNTYMKTEELSVADLNKVICKYEAAAGVTIQSNNKDSWGYLFINCEGRLRKTDNICNVSGRALITEEDLDALFPSHDFRISTSNLSSDKINLVRDWMIRCARYHKLDSGCLENFKENMNYYFRIEKKAVIKSVPLILESLPLVTFKFDTVLSGYKCDNTAAIKAEISSLKTRLEELESMLNKDYT